MTRDEALVLPTPVTYSERRMATGTRWDNTFRNRMEWITVLYWSPISSKYPAYDYLMMACAIRPAWIGSRSMSILPHT